MFTALFRIELLIWFRTKENVFWAIVWPVAWLLMVWGLFPTLPGRSRLDTLEYYYPSGIALALLSACLTSLAIRLGLAKEKNELKRLMLAPLPTRTFFLSELAASSVFSAAAILTITIVCYALGLRIHGNIAASLLVILLGAVIFSAIAFFIAGISSNMTRTSLLSMIAMFAIMLLSKVIFDFSQAPGPLATLSQILPATALCEALRGLMFDGDRVGDHALHFVNLAAWAAGASFLSLSTFKMNQGA